MSSEWFRSLWTAKGRNNRARYWSVTVTLVVMTFGLTALALAGFVNSSDVTELLPILLAPIWLAAFVVSLFNSIKRLHDMGFSGWWILGVLALSFPFVLLKNAPGPLNGLGSLAVTLIELGYAILLGVWPPQKGPNRFGPQPGVATAEVFD